MPCTWGTFRRGLVCSYSPSGDRRPLRPVSVFACRLNRRCDTGVKSLRWGFECQSLTWPLVESTSHLADIARTVVNVRLPPPHASSAAAPAAWRSFTANRRASSRVSRFGRRSLPKLQSIQGDLPDRSERWNENRLAVRVQVWKVLGCAHAWRPPLRSQWDAVARHQTLDKFRV
jgi:hypothetical protein